jgi:hypothetical protein
MNNRFFLRARVRNSRWTTPFIFALAFSATQAASTAQVAGRWLFVDDGSGIEIAPCPIATDGMCGALVQLPKSTANVTPDQRKQLCGFMMLGALKLTKPKKEELLRFDGWVVNPEDLAKTDRPKQYDVSLILISDLSARLDVRGPLGIVLETYRLTRSSTLTQVCQ